MYYNNIMNIRNGGIDFSIIVTKLYCNLYEYVKYGSAATSV